MLRDQHRQQRRRPQRHHRELDPASEETWVDPTEVADDDLRVLVTDYCNSRRNPAERAALGEFFLFEYRVCDVKALHPAVATRIERWVHRARVDLQRDVRP